MPALGKVAVRRVAARAMGAMSIRILPTVGALRRLTVAHVHIPPGTSLPAIRHLKTDELAYVLSGRGWGDIAGRRIRFKPGDLLTIPRGAPHKFRAGPEGVEIIDIFAPALDPRVPDVIAADPPARRRARR